MNPDAIKAQAETEHDAECEKGPDCLSRDTHVENVFVPRVLRHRLRAAEQKLAENPRHTITGDLLWRPMLTYYREATGNYEMVEITVSNDMRRARVAYLAALQKEADEALRWVAPPNFTRQ